MLEGSGLRRRVGLQGKHPTLPWPQPALLVKLAYASGSGHPTVFSTCSCIAVMAAARHWTWLSA